MKQQLHEGVLRYIVKLLIGGKSGKSLLKEPGIRDELRAAGIAAAQLQQALDRIHEKSGKKSGKMKVTIKR